MYFIIFEVIVLIFLNSFLFCRFAQLFAALESEQVQMPLPIWCECGGQMSASQRYHIY